MIRACGEDFYLVFRWSRELDGIDAGGLCPPRSTTTASKALCAVLDDSLTVFDKPTREERVHGGARIPVSPVGVFLGVLDVRR